jgi:hypothetical protein
VLYHLSHSASPQSSLNEGFWVLIEWYPKNLLKNQLSMQSKHFANINL